MKEKDEITELFRHRLKHAKMEVRDGFWESLQQDLSAAPISSHPSKSGIVVTLFHKWIAAASVLLMLGLASAGIWYFSPKEEIQQAFTQVKSMEPSVGLNEEEMRELLPPAWQASMSSSSEPPCEVTANDSALGVQTDESTPVSVNISITIHREVYGHAKRPLRGYQKASVSATSEQKETSSVSNSKVGDFSTPSAVCSPWALKVGVGTAWPQGAWQAPVVAGVSLERTLSPRLSLEAGLQYQRLAVGGATDQVFHAVALPVKLHVACVKALRWRGYASVGGAVEKIVNQGFGEEPLRWSVSAGVGVVYQMNDRLALFAEPSVSHHFDTDSSLRHLHGEKATHLNLLCGIRMTY